MLEAVLTYIHNWFPREIRSGCWKVEDGTIDLPFLKPGQYFRIVGSVFNDGLHRYPDRSMTDEEFMGTVWAMAVPPALIGLVQEIEEWQEKHGADADGALSSESFGGYSYTRDAGLDGSGSADPANGWQRRFMARLIPWRRL